MLKKLYWKAWRIFVVNEILGDTVHIGVKDLAKDVRIIKNKNSFKILEQQQNHWKMSQKTYLELIYHVEWA